MFCSKCGTLNPDEAKFCSKCGQQLLQPVPASVPGPIDVPASPPVSSVSPQRIEPIKHTSGMAIASLVLGILGISLLAIIFGAIAINATSKDPNLTGKGLAIAGLVLGIIGIIISFVVVLALVFVASTST